ncbi:hypothetical protein CC86DRAFT_338706 [Ophiobolus disseminans]|uniref:MutL C-terminal dimerisation domain-containing protein n=1 Tax=Ophiobolus disseminans TaxID=1469910 RepID=A0A6A7ALE9_9PLEO|nr:hypothetical protein CC86DRAFT_338706 [Ophiobolus disseminans]
MSQVRHDGKSTTISTPTGRRILPLPEGVAAQIKSSTAVVSLTGVVLELLKNSLDAGAAKVEATVDFARGACTVEDDGQGVAPFEFREDGGLAKLYCTSKQDARDALLGCNGTFLASLSAVSLLSITSRHHEHRTHNSVTFHHAQTIERQLPASSHHEIHSKHGTRVTVRNLFGNLPVRVKQRSRVLEQKAEGDRLWEALKTNVAGLLLSWAGSVTVRVRDGDNRIIFNFSTVESKQTSKYNTSDVCKPRSAHLTSMLNILTQANYITIDDWPSWVPASASTPALSIKGAISLEPAPTRRIQFISLGVRPLSAEFKHNELYDHVNHLFALSSFGAIEETVDADDLEKSRHQSDKRFKSSGYTNRQLKTQKGVDRYPMFHLRISLHGNLKSSVSEDRFIDEETNVQVVVEVLSAMMVQWLSVHHFRPIKPRQKRKLSPASTTSPNKSTETSPSSNSDAQTSTPSTASVTTRKKKHISATVSGASTEQLRHRAFAEWSRIRSGKADFFTAGTGCPKVDKKIHSAPLRNSDMEHEFRVHSGPTSTTGFMLQPVAQGALNVQMPPHVGHEQVSEPGMENSSVEEDDTVIWTDPLTKKVHLLNARTGCLMPNVRDRPGTAAVLSLPGKSSKAASKSLRLPPKTATAENTPWLDDILKIWNNPVFESSEKRIEQVSMQKDSPDQQVSRHAQHQRSRVDLDKAFSGSLSIGSTRLSKDAFLSAEVIAQVDKKFILIKVMHPIDPSLTKAASAALLVLVDQHAADERIRVEALFQELCTHISPHKTNPRYQSRLGHSALVASSLLSKSIQFTVSQQERMHFVAHAERFARWGILFDILTPTTTSERLNASTKKQHLVSVTALPPSISERCKSDAALLISFLRSTVWKYASDPHRTLQASFSPDETSPEWVRRLATCPQGLIDMINSRACRSAIMFNDELRHDQCKELVQELGRCVFPFMCAHGRPSMVPLVDTSKMSNDEQAFQSDEYVPNPGFARAWKQWKR